LSRLSPSSLIGQTVSHYRVLDSLAAEDRESSSGRRNTRLRRLVALKFLPEDLARNPVAVERFDTRRPRHGLPPNAREANAYVLFSRRLPWELYLVEGLK
jgi:hypothetical protein